MAMAYKQFGFSDHVTLKVVVHPSLGRTSPDSYRVMLPYGDGFKEVSSCIAHTPRFYRDFVENDAVDVVRGLQEGRVVYLYDAQFPVTVRVIEAHSEHAEDIYPHIDSVSIGLHGQSLELRDVLRESDAERLLDRMEGLLDGRQKNK